MQLMLVSIKWVSKHLCTFLKILMPMLYLKLRLAVEALSGGYRFCLQTSLNMDTPQGVVVVIEFNVV